MAQGPRSEEEVAMDPLHASIAVVPMAVYLLLIGWINLSPRAFVTTGARDLAALAIAASGLVIVGPMELFLPERLASIVGGWVWVPMILLYALFVTLSVLLMRPRLVAYNISADQLRPVVKEVLGDLDPDARWAGDSVVANGLGIQLAIEAHSGVRNVALVSVGPEQDLRGWHQLKLHLRDKLEGTKQPLNLQGISFLFLALILAIAVVYSLVGGRQEIAQSVQEMLRM